MPPMSEEELSHMVCIVCQDHLSPAVESLDDHDIEEGGVLRQDELERNKLDDFGELFGCGCSVVSHPACLQLWLLEASKCPMCRMRIGKELSVVRAVSTHINHGSVPASNGNITPIFIVGTSLLFMAGISAYTFL
jgi:hypothetical protein